MYVWLMIAILLAAVLLGLYLSGRIGPTSVRSMRFGSKQATQAIQAFRERQEDPPQSQEFTDRLFETRGFQSAGETPQHEPSTVRLGRSSAADFAVPAALGLAVGLESWLTPDAAAIGALEQVSGETITSALDLRSTIAEGHYKLWSEGSMNMWRGHVGEHQIVEQIASWDPDAVDMPDASNFAGADVSIFGDGYQVKFVKDFDSINNIHGDPLFVAEGTLNVPEDALVLDFSTPFDPSVLEGHDVIVAEGLTLAGAQDAWESAVGIAGGGVDLGDLSETIGDFAVPGIGAAVRVAASGYRRRGALSDPALRGRATGRVVRDVAYTTGGVTAGGTAGAVIGAAVDVLSLGLTMGMGSVLGGMIGAGLGGRAAGKVAAGEDQAEIDAKAQRVRRAIETFGLEAERIERAAQSSWNSATSTADRAARDSARRRVAELDWLLGQANDELAQLARIDHDEAATLLAHSACRLESTSPRSPRDRRLRTLWSASAGLELSASMPDSANVLALVAAAPAGEDDLDRWIGDRWQRRSVLLASAHAASGAKVASALAERASLAAELERRRSEIQLRSKADLAEAVRPVESANSELSRELKLAGR